MQLARARGGTRLYVPATPTDDFVREFGAAAAEALSGLYPNEVVTVPLGPCGAANAARRIADQAIRDGASAGEAARRSGLTERAVYKRKARQQDDLTSAQGRLFE